MDYGKKQFFCRAKLIRYVLGFAHPKAFYGFCACSLLKPCNLSREVGGTVPKDTLLRCALEGTKTFATARPAGG
ncbi:hypothetical protein BG60_09205 [Caballeronia zhejiangensis]|uniref:Uncharacterized protein n=1 Tax=Caballeronia zhejiangensis TaxID=871203 RepID=A0A656QGB4_9BURK|nr:hypothetical protein BG58_28535 [Caballeronia jiangsuensis]KDR28885.1 hypothetical protein BG60_09205 [Caballeronia zhejiangensis]